MGFASYHDELYAALAAHVPAALAADRGWEVVEKGGEGGLNGDPVWWMMRDDQGRTHFVTTRLYMSKKQGTSLLKNLAHWTWSKGHERRADSYVAVVTSEIEPLQRTILSQYPVAMIGYEDLLPMAMKGGPALAESHEKSIERARRYH